MIPIDLAKEMIQDLATHTRIEEYDCATKLYSGDVEGAKQAAKRANIFRQAFFKASSEFLEKLNNDKSE